MTRRPGTWGALALVVACGWLTAALPTAFGEDAKGGGPVVKPTVPVEAPVDLDKELLRHPETLVAFGLLKLLPACLGIAVVVVGLQRASDRRKGFVPPLAPAPAMTVPFGLGLSLLLIVAAMLVPDLLRIAILGIPKKGSEIDAPSLAARLAFTAAGLVPLGLLVAARRRRLQNEGAPPPVAAPVAIWEGLKMFCVACGATLLLGLLAKVILENVFDLEQRAQDLVEMLVKPKDPRDRYLVAAYGVLVAPVIEELVFRGMLQPALTRVGGRLTGMVVTSIVFAGIHVNKLADLHSFFPLIGLAMLLSWLFDRTNSILATTTVHVLNNATSLIPFLLLPAT